MLKLPKSIIVKKNKKLREINLTKHTDGSLERDAKEAKTPSYKPVR